MDILTICLIAVTVLFSYRGFTNRDFYEQHVFDVDRILADKQYYRLLTSGLLHADWMHLIFNMMVLFFFSEFISIVFGPLLLLFLYFGSMLAGKLFALYVHRQHGDYRSLGASGAVNGLVFATVVINPHGSIGLLFLPIGIPSWLFGLAYLGFSMYGIKTRFGNQGHESHFGGAIAGILLAILLQPAILLHNYWIVLLLLIPSVVFLYLLISRPEFRLIDNYARKQFQSMREQQKVKQHRSREDELNALLEKVNTKGMQSLNRSERSRLEELSRDL